MTSQNYSIFMAAYSYLTIISQSQF